MIPHNNAVLRRFFMLAMVFLITLHDASAKVKNHKPLTHDKMFPVEDTNISGQSFQPTATIPSNIVCAGAIEISKNSVTLGSTTDATANASPATPSCGDNGTSPGVWYKISAAGNTRIRASLCESQYDTVLAVFQGSCDSLVCEVYNDDYENCGYQSQVSFISTSTTGEATFFIYVFGFRPFDKGDFTLTLESFEIPSNNECAGAIEISQNSVTLGSTTHATANASPDNSCLDEDSGESPGVWYKVAAGGNTGIRASLCGSQYADTQIAVFQGSSCDSLVCEVYNDEYCGSQSQVSFASRSTTEAPLFIYVFGHKTEDKGDFTLTLESVEIPANNVCAGAIEISQNSVTLGSTTDAAANASPETPSCGDSGTSPGVWYKVADGGYTPIRASLCGSQYDTKIAVFEGSCDSLVCDDVYNDDYCGPQSKVVFASRRTTEDHLFIYVFGFGQGNKGDFMLTLESFEPNNECAGAIEISKNSETSGSTALATVDDNPSRFCGEYNSAAAPGVWYKVSNAGDPNPPAGDVLRKLTASLCGLQYDTLVTVFKGGHCDSLECVVFNYDDAPDYCVQLTFFSEMAEDIFYIYVSGYDGDIIGDSADFILTMKNIEASDEPTPGCADANVEVVLPNSVTIGSTSDAPEGPPPVACVSVESRGRWYSVTGLGGLASASLCDSSYNTVISVHKNSCDSLTCVAVNDDYDFPANCGDFTSYVEWVSESVDDVFLIYVSGYSTVDYGDFELEIIDKSFYTRKELDPDDGRLGAWRDGGVDARVKRGVDTAATGEYAFQIRDNSISKSSMELELPGVRDKKSCKTIDVHFDFMMHGFEQSEAFILEYATYTTDRSPKLERCQWTRAETWVYNPDSIDLDVWMAAIDAHECPLHNIGFTYAEFESELVLYSWEVKIDVSHVTSEDNFSIRFRSDASSNSDRIYFDNVRVHCRGF
jgi:hypothetical protein